ncbi:MAG: response regulator, partial [Chitinispirillia bacterium]|nr:response regulator [Chitinispirillia bacterium]
MPEMDGIQTVQEIRKLGGKYEKLIIVALTANAVKGAREMFAENGFNDFISKPIDANELRGIIKKHLPPEKIQTDAKPKSAQTGSEAREEAGQTEERFLDKLQRVADINPEIGLSRVSRMENMYRDSLLFFNKKLNGELDKMFASLEKRDLGGFSITVHAMKSALSTIGAMGLSELAAALEDASKADKYEYCAEKFQPFEKKLAALNKQLSEVFTSDEPAGEKTKGDETLLIESVEKAIAAANDFDSDLGVEILNELIKYDFGETRNSLLEYTLAALADFNCAEAAESLREIALYKGVN